MSDEAVKGKLSPMNEGTTTMYPNPLEAPDPLAQPKRGTERGPGVDQDVLKADDGSKDKVAQELYGKPYDSLSDEQKNKVLNRLRSSPYMGR